MSKTSMMQPLDAAELDSVQGGFMPIVIAPMVHKVVRDAIDEIGKESEVGCDGGDCSYAPPGSMGSGYQP